ncbi:MAG TPA: hypothetical protein VK206_11785 [Anaerolineales bacterium]|nr:hypothetical protein [Anaerolineales bacterium]HLO27851.1 hypothetical protein [Anaerolineales bacterium]
MKVRVPYRPVHIFVFLLLAFLCYQAHQLTRHLVGAALCSGFGTMTFTVATTRAPCSFPTLVTLSGPLLTYGLAWFGVSLLRSPKYKLFAYALIFASFAHLRFIQTLTGRGDELILAEQWFGVTNRASIAVIVFLIGLLPIIAAFRVIANKRRNLVFICSWLLPLPLLFAMLFGNQFLFGANGNEIQGATILGIPLIVFIADLIAGTLLIMLAPRYLHSPKET